MYTILQLYRFRQLKVHKDNFTYMCNYVIFYYAGGLDEADRFGATKGMISSHLYWREKL